MWEYKQKNLEDRLRIYFERIRTMKIKKLHILLVVILGLSLLLTACSDNNEDTEQAVEEVSEEVSEAESLISEDSETEVYTEIDTEEEEEALEEGASEEVEEFKQGLGGNLTVSAAASLTDVLNELAEIYNENNDVNITYNFAGSGTLQQQIENGADVDIFFSAGLNQMDALVEAGLVDQEDVVNILNNQVVLIKSTNSDLNIVGFESLALGEVDTVAIGDPASVPAGQYSFEILSNLGLLEEIEGKITYATDVRQVLQWVASEEAKAGILYNTDAMVEDGVEVVAEAPADMYKEVIYPLAILKDSPNREVAEDFIGFLLSEESLAKFEEYGFTRVD